MKWIPLGCLLGLFIVVLGPACWHGEVLAFRDTAHYYYPLLQFVLGQWREGRIPLWNPYDGLGTPLAADPTSLAFYPGLVLAAIGRSVGEGVNLFILGHLALAAWGSFRLARSWGAEPAAATLAAISYAFGGTILFQYSNLVYLVGASWLPVGLWAWDLAVRAPRPAHTALAGLTLAAIILGGDFQTAYHLVLLWIFWLVVVRRSILRGQSLVITSRSSPVPIAREKTDEAELFLPGNVHAGPQLIDSHPAPVWVLAVTLLIGLGVSSCLWLPALELGLLSDRQITDQPRSVYEWVWWQIRPPAEDRERTRESSNHEALLGSPRPGTHHAAVFEFSVAPTRWAELIWPNFSGRLFPHNHRWLQSLGGEGRIWTPSLYQGFLVFILALMAFRLKITSQPIASFLSWVAIISLLASLGHFGLGALAQYLTQFARTDSGENLPVGPAFGGVYWLATVLLPGYVSFRYPAKWLSLTSLAFSQLAAQAFRDGHTRSRHAFTILAVLFGGLSAVLLALVNQWQEGIVLVLHRGTADAAFGPLVPAGVLEDFYWAFGQVASLALAAIALRQWGPQGFKLGVILLTTVDLAVANRWLIRSVPEAELATPPAVEKLLTRPASIPPEAVEPYVAWLPFPRVYRSSDEVVPDWEKFSSPRRLTEMVAWQRDSLFSKFHLLVPCGSVSPGTACRPADWQFVLWVAQKPPQLKPRPLPSNGSGHGRAEEQLTVDQPTMAEEATGPTRLMPPGVSHALIRPQNSIRKMVPVVGAEAIAVPSGLVMWRTVEPPAIAWFPREVTVLPELKSRDPRTVWQRTAEVLFPGGQPRDLSRSSVLEVTADVFHILKRLSPSVDASAAAGEEGKGELPGPWWSSQGFLRRVVEEAERVLAALKKHLGPSTPEPHVDSPLRISNRLSEELRCRLLRLEPGEVWLEIQSPQGGLLAIAQQYFPGWEAHLERIGEQGPRVHPPIWRLNRVMQAVMVPPGNWLLNLRYVPTSFWTGATVTAATLFLLTIWLAIRALSLAKSASLLRQQEGARLSGQMSRG